MASWQLALRLRQRAAMIALRFIGRQRWILDKSGPVGPVCQGLPDGTLSLDAVVRGSPWRPSDHLVNGQLGSPSNMAHPGPPAQTTEVPARQAGPTVFVHEYFSSGA